MHDLQSGMAAGRRQSSASGSKSHRTTLYCRQADSACDRKRQKRLICNLLPVAAELGLMSARICNSGLPLKRICNSPAPQNSSAGNSVGYTPRRWDQFPYTSSHRRRLGHLRGTSRAQVIFKKVRPLQYPLPADKKHLTQRAAFCENRWRTDESGLTDFG